MNNDILSDWSVRLFRNIFTVDECNALEKAPLSSSLNLHDEGGRKGHIHPRIPQNCTRQYLAGGEMVDMWLERITKLMDEFEIEYELALDAHIIVYPEPDGYISKHNDDTVNTERTLSIVVPLNDDFDGGELIIYDLDDNPTVIEWEVGDVILFNPRMWHEVTTVTRGIRKTVLFWMQDKV